MGFPDGVKADGVAVSRRMVDPKPVSLAAECVPKKKILCPKSVKFRNLMELGAGSCLRRKKIIKNRTKKKISDGYSKKVKGGVPSGSLQGPFLDPVSTHSGGESICYENLSEIELIGINNPKQWGFVNKDVDGKMKSACEELGLSNLKDRFINFDNKGRLDIEEHLKIVPRKKLSTPSL